MPKNAKKTKEFNCKYGRNGVCAATYKAERCSALRLNGTMDWRACKHQYLLLKEM
jgi:hypothetical protein